MVKPCTFHIGRFRLPAGALQIDASKLLETLGKVREDFGYNLAVAALGANDQSYSQKLRSQRLRRMRGRRIAQRIGFVSRIDIVLALRV